MRMACGHQPSPPQALLKRFGATVWASPALVTTVTAAAAAAGTAADDAPAVAAAARSRRSDNRDGPPRSRPARLGAAARGNGD